MNVLAEDNNPRLSSKNSRFLENLLSIRQVIPSACDNAARSFLRQHGHTSLVSLGCGPELNRVDNHLRLLMALNLTYYVGIDCLPCITLWTPDLFMDHEGMVALLTEYYQGEPEKFREAVHIFPNTWVEELAGLHCAVVVCQRVWPDCHWEEVIASMTPELVLQEDLHGCHRQQLRRCGYVRSWLKIRACGLEPFRPWSIFPGERNFILWRQQDFGDEEVRDSRWCTLWRLGEKFVG
jgi:hypothetical protein